MATKVNPVPEGYHTVTPVLTVQGAAMLIDFLKQAYDVMPRKRIASTGRTVL
jgi:hypothetical protein